MFQTREENLQDFVKSRYGLFIHYGLYSALGRGEWAMNKERISPEDYRKLTNTFNPENFDAEKICALAKRSGMNYICFTTMHHDGFRLYDSELSDFNSYHYYKRDLTKEIVEAARKEGLRIHLYHSLNNWYDVPDAYKALDDKESYEVFIKNTHDRIKEVVTKFNPIDTLWYDGWWPFDAKGWKGEEMNEMVKKIQPHILFNNRNCLPGDFCTPEGNMAYPYPWKPWEACLTLNDNWCYVPNDNDFKSNKKVINMLITAAQGNGNLLLGIGINPDGSIPDIVQQRLFSVNDWLQKNKEAIYNTDYFTCGSIERGQHAADWSHVADFTASGNNLYLILKSFARDYVTVAELQSEPISVEVLNTGKKIDFTYEKKNGKLYFELPKLLDDFKPVIKVECKEKPQIFGSGGMGKINMSHPVYNPV